MSSLVLVFLFTLSYDVILVLPCLVLARGGKLFEHRPTFEESAVVKRGVLISLKEHRQLEAIGASIVGS